MELQFLISEDGKTLEGIIGGNKSVERIVSLIIPEGITTIGRLAFSGLSELKEVVFPKSLKRIRESAFLMCDSLEYVTLPNGLTHIGVAAFMGCKTLRIVNIPQSVSYIGRMAFNGCISLENILVEPSSKFFCSDKQMLYNKRGTILLWCSPQKKQVTLPSRVSHICSFTFLNCREICEIDIPESVKIIDELAFANCERLRTITIRNVDPYAIKVAINSFDELNIQCTLKIPVGSINAYSEHLVFGNFMQIQEIDHKDNILDNGE